MRELPSTAPAAASGAGGRHPTALSTQAALARVAVALAAFVLCSLALRAVAAPPGGSVIGGKLRHWQRHGAQYDTLFVGSSHVFRAFVPAELERAAAELGLRCRAFNLGVPAAHLLEQRHLVHAALDAHPGIARVLFEYQWLQPQLDPENAFGPRSVYWHDAGTTALAVERALHWDAELGGALAFVERADAAHSAFTVLDRLLPAGVRAAKEHVQHHLAERLLLGRGTDVLRGALERDHAQTARYAAGDGYVSIEAEERALAAQGVTRSVYGARRERFLASVAEFRAAVDALATAAECFGDGDWIDPALTRVHDVELVRLIASEVRGRGVELVLVVMPGLSADRRAEERLIAEAGAPVLRYDLPQRYPELYDPALRWDSGHLSEEGARRFTRLLARDLARLQGATPPVRVSQ